MNGKQAKMLRKAARKITEGLPEVDYKLVPAGQVRTTRIPMRRELATSTRGVNKKLKQGYKQERQT